MKKISNFYIVFIAVAIFYFSGCIKSSVIGGDILKDDEINVEYIDTNSVIVYSEKNDSAKVFPIFLKTYLLGTIENDVFGKETASLFCDFRTLGAIPGGNFNIDSVVLTLIIDTLGYGDKNSLHDIKIYKLEENIDVSKTYYSNSQIPNIQSEIGRKEVTGIIDSISVIEPESDTVYYFEQVRIHLDKEEFLDLMNDTFALKSDTLFKDIFKGLYIESNVTGNNSILNVQYIDSGNKNKTRIEVYYTENSELKKLRFNIDNAVSHLEHDYQSSEVINYLGDKSKGDSLLFIQGMEGVKLNIDIPDLTNFKDKNINKAELVFYTLEKNYFDPLPRKFITEFEDFDGEKKYIKDYEEAEGYNNSEFYGGTPEKVEVDGKILYKYTINLTLQLRYLLKQGEYQSKLSIRPLTRILDPGFAKLYGTKNVEFRPRLSVVYSNVN